MGSRRSLAESTIRISPLRQIGAKRVCPVYEIGDAAGTPFIAMKLLEGESLAQRLEKGDLKPSNLFLTPHGVQVLDFGLATLAPAATSTLDPTASHLTQEGTLVGTPRYMSPELVKGDPVDDAGFASVLERAEAARQRAASAFVAEGGERLLGLRPAT